MWEVVGSLHVLQSRVDRAAFSAWLDGAGPRLRRPSVRSTARVLATLAPRDVYFPDFLTPPEPATDVEHGVDAVLSTPRRRLRAELERFGARRRTPDWVGRLAAGDPGALGSLGRAFKAYYQELVAPHESHIESTLAAERARRARTLMHTGTEGLLASLGASMRWQSPVLEVSYPVDYTMNLDGRGLLLVPSYFASRRPVTLADREQPPVLVYPVEHTPPVTSTRGGLAALLGHTRAAVLQATRPGVTTTSVARQAGISPATASHHITVLREAGLVMTHREGNRASHSPTPLGTDLLEHRSRSGVSTRIERAGHPEVHAR